MFLTKAIFLIASSGCVNFNLAQTVKYDYRAADTQIKKEISNVQIIDFNALMLEAIKTNFMFNHPMEYQQLEKITDFKINNLKETNVEITKVGNPILEFDDSKFNFMGENEFINNSDIEQTYQTTSFTQTLVSQIGTSTSLGITLGISKKITIFNFDTAIDYNHVTSIQNSTETKITVAPQPVRLSPHKKVKVHVFWGQKKFIQNLTLNANISGNLTAFFHFKDSSLNQTVDIPISSAVYYLNLANKLPKGITCNGSNQVVNFNGIAQAWQSIVGSSETVITDHEIDI